MITNNQNIELKNFIDLFAGIGGFRIALESFGLKCAFSSEWDKHAQLTYKENFGEVPHGDITKIDEKSIPDHDVLCAGFPCQAFSISGKRKGFEDTRGTLFFDVARIVKEKKPKVLFLENVKNFEKHDSGRTLETVKKTLSDLGYTVYHKVLNAGEFGVPTSRKRIYIIGFRNDLNHKPFVFPLPTDEEIYLKDIIDKNINWDEFEIKRDDIKILKEDSKTLRKKPYQIGKINNGGQGERIYSIYGHAITLSAYGGGVASKTGAYLIDGKVRKLTPNECALVMGFPKNFKIPVSKSQAYKQFGNSVAIPVLKKVFEKVIDSIEPQ